MNILNSFKRNKKKVLPPAVVVGFLLLAGSVAYAFSPQSPLVAKQPDTTNKTIAYKAKPTASVSPTPHITGTQKTAVLGLITRTLTPQPKATPTPTNKQASTTTVSTQSNSTGGTTAINTPAAQQSTPTPTPSQSAQTQTAPAAQTVSVEIKSPDGSSSFTVEHNNGMTVCDILQKAKDNGKIKSVTLDDSYMASLHSKYVSEINGFANNWTFSVNGSSPLGCSLSQPKPNDSIVWKFG